MKVIIAGSRSITNKKLIFSRLSIIHDFLDISEIVCGMCRGPDLIGKEWADENNIPVKEFPADWSKFGRNRAGYVRNWEMANYADALVAFWDEKSTGTRSMIEYAKQKKLFPILILHEKNKKIQTKRLQ